MGFVLKLHSLKKLEAVIHILNLNSNVLFILILNKWKTTENADIQKGRTCK